MAQKDYKCSTYLSFTVVHRWIVNGAIRIDPSDSVYINLYIGTVGVNLQFGQKEYLTFEFRVILLK